MANKNSKGTLPMESFKNYKPHIQKSSLANPDPDADLLLTSQPTTRSLQLAPAISKIPKIYTARTKPQHFDSEEHFILIFPLSSNLKFKESFLPMPEVSGMDMLFVPSFTHVSVYSPTDSGKYIVMPFSPSIQLCHGICPESCYEAHGKKNGKRDSSMIDASKRNKVSITTLSMKPVVVNWLQVLVDCISEGITSLPYYEYKIRELFFFFREFYSRVETDEFLKLFHCTAFGFRAFIFRHHWDCQSVEELAALSGLSLSTFKRTFKEEFHASPLQWINEQKARYLMRDLEETDLSLSELAERYKFSSVSYLCAFCKKMLGETPNTIRRREEI